MALAGRAVQAEGDGQVTVSKQNCYAEEPKEVRPAKLGVPRERSWRRALRVSEVVSRQVSRASQDKGGADTGEHEMT